MTLSRLCSALALLLAATTAQAADINNLGGLIQGQFKDFNKDLTAALGYKAMAPAAPLGVTGFDLGIALSGTGMQNSSVWQTATGHDLSILPVPKLYVTKGLPFGIDIGGFYTRVPSSNIRLYGAEIQYAILEGSALTPAVAVRGTLTNLDGVDQLSFDSQGLELLVSKGFVGVTPYGGIGSVHGKSTAHVASLTSESSNQTKLFAGVNWNVMLANLALEYDRTGRNDSLSAKVGIRW